MIFVIKKTNWVLQGTFGNLKLAKDWLKQTKLNEKDFFITQDFDMKYISRVVYVDGNCIYNNKQFWTTDVYKDAILDNYEEHEVKDFLNQPVDKYRFEVELNTNITRLSSIDGLAGEIDYNMTVGDEFIALFREECVKTDFKGITPLEIGIKLAPVISLVQTGSFREAKQVLQSLETDPFLTEERIAKYIAMMDSADAIEYATPEEYFYTASSEE